MLRRLGTAAVAALLLTGALLAPAAAENSPVATVYDSTVGAGSDIIVDISTTSEVDGCQFAAVRSSSAAIALPVRSITPPSTYPGIARFTFSSSGLNNGTYRITYTCAGSVTGQSPVFTIIPAAQKAILNASKPGQSAPGGLTAKALTIASLTYPPIYKNHCHMQAEDITLLSCIYGDPNGTKTVWLVGDSHAAQWFPALNQIANTNHWRLVVHTRSACPLIDEPLAYPGQPTLPYPKCSTWQTQVVDVAQQAKPDLIVTGATVALVRGHMESFGRVLTRLTSTSKVLVLGDTPRHKISPPTCLTNHQTDYSACITPRYWAEDAKTINDMAVQARNAGAGFKPTINWFCTSTACPPAVDDKLLYRDATHLTVDAAIWARNYLVATLNSYLPTRY